MMIEDREVYYKRAATDASLNSSFRKAKMDNSGERNG